MSVREKEREGESKGFEGGGAREYFSSERAGDEEELMHISRGGDRERVEKEGWREIEVE